MLDACMACMPKTQQITAFTENSFYFVFLFTCVSYIFLFFFNINLLSSLTANLPIHYYYYLTQINWKNRQQQRDIWIQFNVWTDTCMHVNISYIVVMWLENKNEWKENSKQCTYKYFFANFISYFCIFNEFIYTLHVCVCVCKNTCMAGMENMKLWYVYIYYINDIN